MKRYAAHTNGRPATHKNAFVKRKEVVRHCGECGKPSKYLGAASGTCPSCQNKSVAALERAMGMEPGTLGRVDRFGNEK